MFLFYNCLGCCACYTPWAELEFRFGSRRVEFLASGNMVWFFHVELVAVMKVVHIVVNGCVCRELLAIPQM